MVHRLTRRLLPFVLAVTACTGLAFPIAARGAPIDDKRAQAAQLEAQITDASAKLSALDEQINDAQVQLDTANAAIADADAKVDAARARTKLLKQIVAERAVSLYTHSGSDATIDGLDTTRASDLNAQQKYTSLAAERDQHAMDLLKKSQEDLAARKADAVQARDTAQSTKAQIESVRAEMTAGQQQLEALKNNVDGEIAAMVAQAEADRIAQERATVAEQLRAATGQSSTPAAVTLSNTTPAGASTNGTTNATTNAPPPSTSTSDGSGDPGPGSSGGATWSPPPTSGRVGAVMAYAYAQLGKPYCYAGVGPDCYDCSGLTMMAWGQAGLSLPHGSYAQLAMFPSVPMSQLQVGDLVYWPDHVGIYVGGGAVLHAPHTGTVVQITQIWGGVIGANRPG